MAKKTLKIAHLKITDHLILGVADAIQKKSPDVYKHFNLELQCKVGWNEVGDAIRKKEVDGAFILAPFAQELFISGAKIKLLLFGHRNGSILIRNHRANVNSIEDFKGKLVIFPYQLSVHTMLFHMLLKEKGLQLGPGKDVQIEVMAPSQMVQALEWDETGEIGGFIVAEPFGSECIKKGFGKELRLSKDIWPKHPCCVFVMQEDSINENKDAVAEFVEALVKSGRFIMENPKVAAGIGATFLSQDVDVVERVLTDPPDRITTNELFPVVDDLVRIQEYMKTNLGKLATPIDYNQFVDTQYAKAAGAK